MRRQIRTAGCLMAVTALVSCSSAAPSGAGGVRVQARHDVILSDHPLGDVVVGDLEQGDEVTAVCFVRSAQSNAGHFGSAIKVTAGDLEGYAAVTDFPEDLADRESTFDLDPETLRDRLPACSE